MKGKKQKSFNGQVYEKAYQRLKLSPTDRIIFQRLLGLFIRNDKPFPYSAPAMAKLTGFSVRTVFNSFNYLERIRLIERIGMGKNRKFKRGSILSKIMTTVQNRSKIRLTKNPTTVQDVHQNLNNRATGAYKKTSSFLKLKENDCSSFFTKEQLMAYHEYKKMIENDRFLGVPSGDVEILEISEWLKENNRLPNQST